MTGTILNAAAVILGGLIGLFFGQRISSKLRETLVHGLGLFTMAYGVFIFMKTQNILIPLISLIIGTIFGEWWLLEDRLETLGESIKKRIYKTQSGELATKGDSRNQYFVDGFVTASLLFCIGPMAILGSLQDGLTGDYQMLAIKSLLDGIAAIAFASTLGVGGLFSAVIVFLYQGAISLAAKFIGQGFGEATVNEMTAVGGLILLGIGISNLLGLKKIRTGSFLPALFVVVLLVILLEKFGIAY